MHRMTQDQLNLQLFRAVREAICNNNLEAVKKSIDDGADVKARDNYGATSLEIAELYKSTEIAALLKQHGASLTQEQLNERLFQAVDVEGAKKAIEDGADVNNKNEYGFTPLHSAAYRGHTDVAKLLLENGADINAKVEGGFTPLCWASMWGNTEIAALLKQHGASLTQDQLNEQLFEAVRTTNREGIKQAIEKGADVNARNEDGWTPLYLPARYGYTEIAKMLLEKGADVNAKSDDGNIPLHWAAVWGYTETAELLIEAGADVNAKDEDGYTPLQWAVENEQTETANLLKQHGGLA